MLIYTDQSQPHGFAAMDIARAKLFFSFNYLGNRWDCVLVEWFKKNPSSPDPLTGMWRVIPEKEYEGSTQRKLGVIALDTVIRNVHLEPDFKDAGNTEFPLDFDYTTALDAFRAYFVNKYADGHLFQLLFM
jgi:hypothetical protein